jgi:hypothetical protein
MKKIIGGQRYDTDKATLLTCNQTSAKAFSDWCEESLYVTERGNWFLVGEGYANTRWCTIAHDGMRGPGGLDLLPITETEALEWLERHGETALIEQHFDIEDA